MEPRYAERRVCFLEGYGGGFEVLLGGRDWWDRGILGHGCDH